jgi:hypothetical protein
MVVGILTDTVSTAATYAIDNIDITGDGLIAAAASLSIKLGGHIIKRYIPNIAAWNTSGQIRRTLKKVYKQF